MRDSAAERAASVRRAVARDAERTYAQASPRSGAPAAPEGMSRTFVHCAAGEGVVPVITGEFGAASMA